MSLLSLKFHMKGAARVTIKAAIIFSKSQASYILRLLKRYHQIVPHLLLGLVGHQPELQGENGKVYLLGKGVRENLS